MAQYRHEHMEVTSRFQDQFTKLHLWTLDKDGYDWVFYMDSDVLVVRSLVPMFRHVLFSAAPSTHTLWAARDFPSFPETFNMGMFAVQPNSTEFERLIYLLHNNHSSAVAFQEGWMEQGFLNAVYRKSWNELPWVYAMNLDTWGHRRDVWDANATQIQAIHYTVMKPWDAWCPWTQYAPLCYLFWHRDEMLFHRVY